MKAFLLGTLAIAFAATLTIFVLLINVEGIDVTYSLLAGAFVGSLASLLSLVRADARPDPALSTLGGVAGGAFGWLLGQLFLRASAIPLYGSKQVAFALLVGLVGGATTCIWLLQGAIGRRR